MQHGLGSRTVGRALQVPECRALAHSRHGQLRGSEPHALLGHDAHALHRVAIQQLLHLAGDTRHDRIQDETALRDSGQLR